MSTTPTSNAAAFLEPRQARSRRSWERVLDATRDLLIARGRADFAIADVSNSAGVSIGSIYGRVPSKAALLEAVHEREMVRIDEETVAAMAAAAVQGDDLAASVTALVEARVRALEGNAPLLVAVIRIAEEYPAVARRGIASGQIAQTAFIGALASICIRNRVDCDEPELAWCEEIVYSLASRQVGIGLVAQGGPQQRMTDAQLVSFLTSTVTSFLRREELDHR
jgi:AcrR family transcriptional regulator